jgi:hypothetical protein
MKKRIHESDLKSANGAISIIVVIALTTGSFMFMIPTQTASATGWNIEVIDSLGFVGWNPSIKLNGSGYPRMSYYHQGNGDLKYAKWTGSAWSLEIVDSFATVGDHTSLDLDGNEYPHVSYYALTNMDLKYARWNGTDWNIEIVDSTGDVGWDTSIAVNASGYAHISYYDHGADDLKYANWTGSGWNIEIVDFAGDVGRDSSIALDSNGYPHITYSDWTNGDLKYANWTGSSWNIDIPDPGSGGMYTSLVLDSNDNAHISYYDGFNFDLKYANWTGSDWSLQTLDSVDIVGYHTAIALDGSENPGISYYNFTGGDLKYAKWTSSGWTIATVDTAGDVGQYTSIAIDSGGYAHICYYDDTSDDLKYAKEVPVEPNAPKNLQASPSAGQITLTWDPPDSDGGMPITNYVVYRGTSSGGLAFNVELGVVLTYVDTGLDNGETYYYVVRAKNVIGDGPDSNEASATTPNEVPQCTISLPLGGSTISGIVTISGTASDPDGSVEKVEVRIDNGPWSQADGTANWNLSWDTSTASEGELVIHARAYDGADYSPTVNVTVHIDNSKPEDKTIFEELWFWALIIILVIIFVVIIALIAARKKKSPPSTQPPTE